MGLGKVTVGWTRSRWPWSSAGIEYERVRTASIPVSSCLKTEKSASNNLLALLTGTSNESQSPEGEIVSAAIPFSFNQALTASTLSCVGATSRCACGRNKRIRMGGQSERNDVVPQTSRGACHSLDWKGC